MVLFADPHLPFTYFPSYLIGSSSCTPMHASFPPKHLALITQGQVYFSLSINEQKGEMHPYSQTLTHKITCSKY